MRPILLPTLLTLSALSLVAQDSPRFGLQVGLVDPQGDLKTGVDSKKGFSLGLSFTFDLGNGWEARPRVDYLSFPAWETHRASSSATYSFQSSDSQKFSHTAIGMDFLLHPDPQQKRFYLVGGLSFIAWKGSYESTYTWQDPFGSQTIHDSFSKTWNKPGFTLGAGWNLGSRGFGELRYTLSKIGDGDSSANTVILSLGCKF